MNIDYEIWKQEQDLYQKRYKTMMGLLLEIIDMISGVETKIENIETNRRFKMIGKEMLIPGRIICGVCCADMGKSDKKEGDLGYDNCEEEYYQEDYP